MDSKPVVNGVYEHIENGGVRFSVTNKCGPTIEIKASHFGNVTNSIELHVTKESLRNLSKMFAEASEQEYEEDYVCASESRCIDKNTGKVLALEGSVAHSAVEPNE